MTFKKEACQIKFLKMIIIKARYLKNLLEKSIGLIAKKKIEPIYFEARFGIHTFGVKKPIDLLILDRGYVRYMKENMKPNCFYFWNPLFDQVLELPAGMIKKKKIFFGSRIKLKLI